MISYLNVKQLEALAEIPKSLVVDCNGEPDGTIYFTKVNKSAVSYYDIIRYLDKFTAPTVRTRADIAFITGDICTQPHNKNSQATRWLIISHEYRVYSCILSAVPSWDDRQGDVELNLEHNPNRIFFFLSSGRMVKAKMKSLHIIFYQVSDTPTPPTLDEYSVEDKVLFIKSYEDCFPRPGFYSKFVESSSFEELNRTRKTLIDRLNVVKSRLVYLVQNDDTEDQP